jgi:hypothetical protein
MEKARASECYGRWILFYNRLKNIHAFHNKLILSNDITIMHDKYYHEGHRWKSYYEIIEVCSDNCPANISSDDMSENLDFCNDDTKESKKIRKEIRSGKISDSTNKLLVENIACNYECGAYLRVKIIKVIEGNTSEFDNINISEFTRQRIFDLMSWNNEEDMEVTMDEFGYALYLWNGHYILISGIPG